MSARRKVHLDYRELHRTGRRVVIDRSSKMGDNELRNRSIGISSDVDDLFETYDLAGIEDLDELSEFINTINFMKYHKCLLLE